MMSSIKYQSLRAEQIPLEGRHLIEASAGTGKTFNIVRLYLRMLLERQLDVRNILVMTFTRAATEELRGRITSALQTLLLDWGKTNDDPYLTSLYQNCDGDEARMRLRKALLFMDEAAIYTIHGFCKRVLSEQAFASGLNFSMQMEADTRELELEAIRDWYRQISGDTDALATLARRYPVPEAFFREFRTLIGKEFRPEHADEDQLLAHYHAEKNDCHHALVQHQDEIFELLVDSHKDAEKRTMEWELLLDWLGGETLEPMPKIAAGFISGSRYRKASAKEVLDPLFEPLRQLKTKANKIEEQLHGVKCDRLIAQGLSVIQGKLEQSKQQRQVMNFDDLVRTLDAALQREQGAALAKALRQQYPVALVDEFQDTDPVQYRILQSIYRQDATLYLIGDPKQAIYAFRGGDVFAYLAARHDVDHYWHIDTNWRSTQDMVSAYNRLFYGALPPAEAVDVFGFSIEYNWVKAAGVAEENALRDPARQQALQLVSFSPDERYAAKSGPDRLKQGFRAVVAAWCACEIDRLLTAGCELGDKALAVGDIAVLVRDGREAEEIQAALAAAGYPSVYTGGRQSLFASEEAAELHQVLLGIIDLEDERRMVAAFSTRYFNGDTARLNTLQQDDDYREMVSNTLLILREQWQESGFVTMAMELIHGSYQPDERGHERSLTNTIHLVELLQHASQRHRQPRELLAWFEEQIASGVTAEENELRLESNERLIRIVTQHGAKGLEYPVVFVPFPTRYRNPLQNGNRNRVFYEWHDRATLQPKLWLGYNADVARYYGEEQDAESVRLLYVAVTRAQYRCYVCAAPFENCEQSPLGRTLALEKTDVFEEALTNLASSSAGSIGLIHVTTGDFVSSLTDAEESDDGIGTSDIAAADFKGHIERDWWLSSFSALTRNLRHGGVSRPDRDFDASQPTVPPRLQGRRLAIRFALQKGAGAGNLLHDVLEHADFTEPDWAHALAQPLRRFGSLPEGYTDTELCDWLEECLRTTLPDGPALHQLQRHSTLRESEFYFPVEKASLSGLAELLLTHRRQQPEGCLTDDAGLPDASVLHGMMHGFIDLVFEWQGRFYVVDYKSTYLGDDLDDYDEAALWQNVQGNYYDLQYLLYSLALHRYLENRLDAYTPQQHFGGVYYLYLRGMAPGKTGGIHKPLIDVGMLQKLDTLFRGSA